MGTWQHRPASTQTLPKGSDAREEGDLKKGNRSKEEYSDLILETQGRGGCGISSSGKEERQGGEVLLNSVALRYARRGQGTEQKWSTQVT